MIPSGHGGRVGRRGGRHESRWARHGLYPRLEKLASASSEQAAHRNEVDAAVSELECDTHHNAAMAEQSSAASALLREQVTRLNERTALFGHAQDDRDGLSGAEPAQLRRYG
jgi:hypothetical protein